MTYSVNISVNLPMDKSRGFHLVNSMKRWLHTPSIEDVESDNDEYGNPVIYVTMDCGNVYTIGANMMDKELI
jgi:hypothetical protein